MNTVKGNTKFGKVTKQCDFYCSAWKQVTIFKECVGFELCFVLFLLGFLG